VFHMNIAKVDRDVAYAASVSKVVASVCLKCFIYFKRILQAF
jgi:hypothetical protein